MIFRTNRLNIRPFGETDIQAAMDLYMDEEVIHYFPEDAYTRENISTKIRDRIQAYSKESPFGVWAVTPSDNNQLIGHAALCRLDNTNEIEIGYLFAKELWKQGFGFEVAEGLVNYARERTDLKRLVAIVDPNNLGSLAIMKKLGMQQIGMAHHYGVDVMKYELSL